MNKCYGCGIELQTDSKDHVGFVSAKALEKDRVYCKRCFDIIHYNKDNAIVLHDDEYLKMLQSIPKGSLIVLVVDIFDLSATLEPAMEDLLAKRNVILAVNKTDVLGPNFHYEKVMANIYKYYQALDINILDGTLISAKFDHEIDYMVELIDQYKQEFDVYVVGVSNVGKSSFVMNLMRHYDIETDITISSYKATTLKMLQFDCGFFNIYDTPGLINRKQMIHYVSNDDIKFLFPVKIVKPVTYQISANNSLFISGLLKVNVLSGDKTSLICYFNENITYHRKKTVDSDKFYQMHKGQLLTPSYVEDDFVTHKITLREFEELSISGFGFIRVNQKVDLEIVLHRNVGYDIRMKLL